MTVVQLVDRERRRLAALLLGAGTLLALAATALVIAAGVLALGDARWITRPLAPLLVWLGALLLAGLAWWAARRRLRRDGSRAQVAAAIERERALRAGMLRGVLEVSSQGPLGARAARDVATRLSSAGPVLAPQLRRRAVHRGAVAAIAALLALALFGTARAASPDGWLAMSHPVRALRGTLLPPIRIAGAPRFALRGERVRLPVEAPGRRTVTLHARATGSPWIETPLAVDAGRAFATVGPLDADLTMVVSDGRSRSDTVVIRVTDRPFVGDVALRAHFPSYLGRPSESVPVGEPARLPRGTMLEIAGRASTALRSVSLAHGSRTIALRADGHAFTGRLSLQESGVWQWSAAGTAGVIADLPAPLEIEVVPDSAPRVEIVSPGRDTVIAPADRLTLDLLAADDHGLAEIVLRSWRRTAAGRELPAVTQRLATAQPAPWSGDAEMDLAARGLEAGDALHIVVMATDNSPWAQRGTSRELVLRVPSLSERREMARDAADSALARASAAAQAQRQLAQRTGEAARARGNRNAPSAAPTGSSARGRETPAMSFESAERAEALVREQRELTEKVRAVEDAARKLEQQLREAGALDAELSARLREAQQLLRDALTPELAEQMRALEQAVQQLSGEQARAALADLAKQQQMLREQLEKSVEMLRRAALEGAMETMRDEAQEIAQRERALADSLARAAASPDEARRLQERAEQLARDVARLSERLAQANAETGATQAERAAEHADASAEAMRRAAEAAARDSARGETGRRQAAEAGDSAARRQASERGEDGAARDDQQRESRAGESQTAQSQAGQSQAGQSQAGQSRSGERQGGESQGSAQQAGQQSPGSRAAEQAAQRMDQAAQALADARESQVQEWKSELAQEMDRSIQEMLQLSREQQALENKVRQGSDPQSMRGDQSAVQQGVDKAAERLQQQGAKSSLLSPGSRRAVGEAQRAVSQATEQVSDGRGGNSQTANAMRDAAEALNRAAASLVRDRERVNRASSASGFAEMVAQMQELAKRQGGVNSQAQGLLQLPMGQSEEARAAGRALARQQRSIAQGLEELGDADGSGKANDLAKEARQIAEALERGRLDPGTLARQQQLLDRLLDAGRTYDDNDQDQSQKREARAAGAGESYTPAGDEAKGDAATRFREPSWTELRGLTAEERRAVMEYFKRINAEQPRR